MGLMFAIVFGIALIAGYVALGVWLIRKTWSWSDEIQTHLVRVALVSLVATLIFMPGVVGAGHGVGVGPAWLMFASGTFGALTGASKLKFLIATAICWGIAFAITHFLTGPTKRTRWDRDFFGK